MTLPKVQTEVEFQHR